MKKGVNGSPVIGVDIGGTKIAAGIVSKEGRLLKKRKRAIEADNGKDVDDIVEMASHITGGRELDSDLCRSAVQGPVPGTAVRLDRAPCTANPRRRHGRHQPAH